MACNLHGVGLTLLIGVTAAVDAQELLLPTLTTNGSPGDSMGDQPSLLPVMVFDAGDTVELESTIWWNADFDEQVWGYSAPASGAESVAFHIANADLAACDTIVTLINEDGQIVDTFENMELGWTDPYVAQHLDFEIVSTACSDTDLLIDGIRTTVAKLPTPSPISGTEIMSQAQRFLSARDYENGYTQISEIHVEDATSLRIHFTQFDLNPESAFVVIGTMESDTFIPYDIFGGAYGTEAFWTRPFPGDTLQVLFVDTQADTGFFPGFVIDQTQARVPSELPSEEFVETIAMQRIETPHPLPIQYADRFMVDAPDAASIRVHVSQADFEDCHGSVEVRTQEGTVLASYNTSELSDDLWSPWFDEERLWIHVESRASTCTTEVRPAFMVHAEHYIRHVGRTYCHNTASLLSDWIPEYWINQLREQCFADFIWMVT